MIDDASTERPVHCGTADRPRRGCRVDTSVVRDFSIASLIGALVGIEERRQASDSAVALGGLRTSPWIFVTTLAAVAAAVVTGYVLESRSSADSLGLTTEV